MAALPARLGIPTLLIFFCSSDYAMLQSPTKKARTTKSLFARKRNPLCLKELAAQAVVNHISEIQPPIHMVCEDIRTLVCHALLKTMKSKFSYPKEYGEDIDQDIISQCSFSKTGKHIICLSNKSPSVRIFDLQNILKSNKISLDHPQTTTLNFDKSIIHVSTDKEPTARQFTLFAINNMKMERFESFLQNKEPYSYSAHTKLSLNPPLPAPITDCATHSDNTIIALTKTKAKNRPYQQVWQIDQDGNTLPITKPFNDIPAIAIHPGKEKSTIIICTNGSINIIDTNKRIHTYDLIDDTCKTNEILCTAVSPNYQKITVGLTEGKLRISRCKEQSAYTITDNNPTGFTALRFLDNERLICARELDKDPKATADIISIQLWDIDSANLLASFRKTEIVGCNSIDIDPEKKFIVFGMGFYDIALRSLDSFNVRAYLKTKFS